MSRVADNYREHSDLRYLSTPPSTRWQTFAGCVLVVVLLYWAQTVLVPVALALLLTFVLSAPVTWLERRIGRAAAVLTTAILVFTLLGLASWALIHQLNLLAQDLPQYRVNIVAKIADVRGAGKGGSVEKLQETVDDIKRRLGEPVTPTGTLAQPVVVTSEHLAGVSGFSWLTPFVGPLGTAGLVITMVIFMLLERRDLRDRLLGLVGHGHLALTTRAFDEASTRVSRQLLMQSLVNVIYGTAAGIGLYLLHVPYPLLWAVLAAALRFIPYIGPLFGAAAPVLVSLAALTGWIGPLLVLVLFVVLELFTNLVLETVLYAGAAGVSQVALLVSVAFWTWLWGPLGLLMATPLTVCLVVIGKHVPGLEFVATLMADSGALPIEHGYYQRVLAHDMSEAADLVEHHIQTQPPRSVYDALFLPALSYAKRDRLEHRLSTEEETEVLDASRELLIDMDERIRDREATHAEDAIAVPEPVPADQRQPVFGYASNGAADELALGMLARVVEDLPLTVEITSARMSAGEMIANIRQRNIPIVCFSDMPPSTSSKTRYYIKRLRGALPDLRILVGRWSPSPTDENAQELRDAGADLVAFTLTEARTYLEELQGT